MRIVALTSGHYPGQFVLGQVANQFPIECLVRVDASRSRTMKQWVKRGMRSLWRGGFFNAVEQRVFYKHANRLREELVTELTAEKHTSVRAKTTLDVRHEELHSDETVERISAIKPDVLLICCSPLIKESIFSLPSIDTVNVHFGISPTYRGSYTLFWPLYHRDFENLGVTVHQVNSGVDAGDIFAQGFMRLDRNDSEATLWAKAVELGGELAIQVLKGFQNGLYYGKRQSDLGRNYRASERRLVHDLVLQWRSRFSKQLMPERPSRIVNYMQEAEDVSQCSSRHVAIRDFDPSIQSHRVYNDPVMNPMLP